MITSKSQKIVYYARVNWIGLLSKDPVELHLETGDTGGYESFHISTYKGVEDKYLSTYIDDIGLQINGLNLIFVSVDKELVKNFIDESESLYKQMKSYIEAGYTEVQLDYLRNKAN